MGGCPDLFRKAGTTVVYFVNPIAMFTGKGKVSWFVSSQFQVVVVIRDPRLELNPVLPKSGNCRATREFPTSSRHRGGRLCRSHR